MTTSPRQRRLRWWVAGGALATGLLALAAYQAAPRPSPPAGPEPEPPAATGPPLFRDLTASAGIKHTYRNGEEVNQYSILESLGGGVALIDYDNDGLLDVFVTGGGYYAGPDKKTIKGHPCRLYKNLGGFQFKDVTKDVGLDRLAGGRPWFYSHGAAVADYDRDGWPDLLVTGWGRVALFRNAPDGRGGRRFLDVSKQAGLDRGITWTTSAAWADLDGDGWPDLYVCQYVDWSFNHHPECTYDGKTRDVCPPKQFTGLPHLVFHNVPADPRNPGRDRRFVDVSNEAGLRIPRKPADYEKLGYLSKSAREVLEKADNKDPKQTEFGKGLGVLAVDVNGDGKPDLYVANDTVDNFLYVNVSVPGQIRFREEGMFAGVARDGNGAPNGSMGVDAGDPDGSGKPWLWVTNYENELHALYRNLSDGDRVYFGFHTPAAGIAAIGQKYVGWGTGFLDVDHHGWEDLFIANGHAIRYPTGQGSARRQKPVFLRNWKGKFKDLTARGGSYFEKVHLARGVGLGDLDNDGKVDLVVSHMNERVAILRNVAEPPAGKAYHWLGVELAGKDHADIVGARVILESGGRKQTRFAKGGGSYASSGDRRHVFGLGEQTTVDRLTVIWPDGTRKEWRGLAPDRYYRLTQGRPDAEPRPGPKK
jgi:enediyne biosynthesis protein E4